MILTRTAPVAKQHSTEEIRALFAQLTYHTLARSEISHQFDKAEEVAARANYKVRELGESLKQAELDIRTHEQYLMGLIDLNAN